MPQTVNQSSPPANPQTTDGHPPAAPAVTLDGDAGNRLLLRLSLAESVCTYLLDRFDDICGGEPEPGETVPSGRTTYKRLKLWKDALAPLLPAKPAAIAAGTEARPETVAPDVMGQPHVMEPDSIRALIRAHQELDRLGIPSAIRTACDDPTCDCHIVHRIRELGKRAAAPAPAARAEGDELLSVLRRVEWRGVLSVLGGEAQCCPSCHGVWPESMSARHFKPGEVGHRSNCDLAAALSAPPASAAASPWRLTADAMPPVGERVLVERDDGYVFIAKWIEVAGNFPWQTDDSVYHGDKRLRRWQPLSSQTDAGAPAESVWRNIARDGLPVLPKGKLQERYIIAWTMPEGSRHRGEAVYEFGHGWYWPGNPHWSGCPVHGAIAVTDYMELPPPPPLDGAPAAPAAS